MHVQPAGPDGKLVPGAEPGGGAFRLGGNHLHRTFDDCHLELPGGLRSDVEDRACHPHRPGRGFHDEGPVPVLGHLQVYFALGQVQPPLGPAVLDAKPGPGVQFEAGAVGQRERLPLPRRGHDVLEPRAGPGEPKTAGQHGGAPPTRDRPAAGDSIRPPGAPAGGRRHGAGRQRGRAGAILEIGGEFAVSRQEPAVRRVGGEPGVKGRPVRLGQDGAVEPRRPERRLFLGGNRGAVMIHGAPPVRRARVERGRSMCSAQGRPQQPQGAGVLLLNGADRNAQPFGDLAVGEHFHLAQEQDRAAALRRSPIARSSSRSSWRAITCRATPGAGEAALIRAHRAGRARSPAFERLIARRRAVT